MLNSLYEKAIAKRGFIHDIDSETDVESQLEYKWFNRDIAESSDDFSIAAGDGSFNKKKFLTTNFCAVGAESIIYDGEIKKIDDSDIFDISHVSFLDELLGNYMAIYELKCAIRTIKDYNVDYYNLDVIISVGYRVKSHRGTQFRIWAMGVLKEYMKKGFALDDNRLKNLGGGNYFDELLARIRDIRSSEKVFWRKVLEIYATSIDYDPNAESSILFFKQVQNKMH